MKTCSRCCNSKPLSEFYKSKTSKDRLAPWCKICCRLAASERRKTLHPDYFAWSAMRQRCNNVNSLAYNRYGGRGITVCKDWDKFATFSRDMGPRPSAKHQIDRIDNDMGYFKENCRWVTSAENNRNRRSTVINEKIAEQIRFLNAEHGLSSSEISQKIGVKYQTVREVITGRSWKKVPQQ